MKFKRVTALFLILLSAIVLSGCVLQPLLQNKVLQERISIDRESVDQTASNVAAALDAADGEALLALFSYNTQTAVDDLAKQVNELLEFYEGGSTTFTIEAGPMESKRVSDGIVEQYFKVSLLLKSDAQQYYMALHAYTRDDADSGNVGITSLYIMRVAESDTPFAYWGDGNWTPGITIQRNTATSPL